MRAEPSALRTTVTREEEITVTSAENPPPVTARAADLSTRIAARVDTIILYNKKELLHTVQQLLVFI